MSVESVGFKKLLDDAFKLYSTDKITIEEYCDRVDVITGAQKTGTKLSDVGNVVFFIQICFYVMLYRFN